MTPPHDAKLVPLVRLGQRHPDVEGQAVWWEEGAWQAQDHTDDMIDGEEIAFYAEGLLAEGFGLHWQVLAEADAPKEPVVVLLLLWQSGPTPPLPPVEDGWLVLSSGEVAAA